MRLSNRSSTCLSSVQGASTAIKISPSLRCQRKPSLRQPRLQLVAAQSLDYRQAGVDIDAGAELVKRIQKLNPSIGGFSGLVPFGEE